MGTVNVDANGEHLWEWPGRWGSLMPACDAAATFYQIRVRGIVDASWSVRLGGMEIARECCADRAAVTILSGELPDQAKLFGVLSTLYGLGHVLLSVRAQQIR